MNVGLLLITAAFADPAADALARIDLILAEHGSTRIEATAEQGYCSQTTQGPPQVALNRQALCANADLVGQWELRELRAEGGMRVSAKLGVLRYNGEEAASRAREHAWVRYGDGTVGLWDGATAWCYADAIWSGELLWTLEYGCNVSVPHVVALKAVRSLLLELGEPHHGAVGVAGTHSGWAHLTDAQGVAVRATAEQRSWSWAKVVGVVQDDVLWIRDRAPDAEGSLGEKKGKLRHDATCVPVIKAEGAWWQVAGPMGTGWASSRYLEAQSDCPESTGQ